MNSIGGVERSLQRIPDNSPTRLLLTNATFVTMNDAFDVIDGALLVENGAIRSLHPRGTTLPACDVALDLGGHAVLPGFVQSHIHCCQTLFRGAADDLPLLDWLMRRIWPLEAAHDAASIAAAARLTALELLLGGTTAFLSMETVRHTDVCLTTLAALPVRARVGKCLMDHCDHAPDGLREEPRAALAAAIELAHAWPASESARVAACLAPRFAVSCTDGLLRDVAAAAAQHDLLVHTHGAEQTAEVELVRQRCGKGNVRHLADVDLLGPRLRLAHAVHPDPGEPELLAETGAHVLHCPSSNLKLGSGIAPIVRYLGLGIPVSLGADGAACNNNLDALREARLAALLQKASAGPAALPAREALRMMARAGAAALGLERALGSIEPGKRADLVEIALDGPHVEPCGDVASRVIYAADRSDIVRVWFDGTIVVERGVPTWCDPAAIVADARAQRDRLFSRAGIAR